MRSRKNGSGTQRDFGMYSNKVELAASYQIRVLDYVDLMLYEDL